MMIVEHIYYQSVIRKTIVVGIFCLGHHFFGLALVADNGILVNFSFRCFGNGLFQMTRNSKQAGRRGIFTAVLEGESVTPTWEGKYRTTLSRHWLITNGW